MFIYSSQGVIFTFNFLCIEDMENVSALITAVYGKTLTTI